MARRGSSARFASPEVMGQHHTLTRRRALTLLDRPNQPLDAQVTCLVIGLHDGAKHWHGVQAKCDPIETDHADVFGHT